MPGALQKKREMFALQRDLFERTPVPKAYLKLAVPVVLAMVLNVVYNMADTWFISMTGNTDLVAGVSVCAPLFVLSIAMGDIWGLGGSSLMSRLLGNRRDGDAGRLSRPARADGSSRSRRSRQRTEDRRREDLRRGRRSRRPWSPCRTASDPRRR